MAKKTIAVLPGDGVGPEIMEQALRVLEAVGKKFGHTFEFKKGLVGGAAYEVHQSHFPDETKNLARASDAILFGSTGGPVNELHLPKWKDCERNSILALRKTFNFATNYRPVKVMPELASNSPLKAEIIERGIDILFIRELLGDVYFGEHKSFTREGMRVATDIAEYTEEQVRVAAHAAFRAAGLRRKHVTSVDKANVLEISRLWRTVVHEVAKEYPEITLVDMLVDNCAMQLVRDPAQFDVVVTSNLFGDILSDAGAVLPGSLGLLASASMNAEGFGLFEPPAGSAPDIAGKGVANPIGQILSAAMMLRFAFAMEDEAKAIERAVEETIRAGVRTRDITGGHGEAVGTKQMAEAILSRL